MKTVAFIYTELQKFIFKTITERKIESIPVIYPSHRKEIPDSDGDYIPIITSDQNLTIHKSRALAKETTSVVERVTSGKPFELWLASCDTPIGQILINHKNCKRTVLLEDGIGSYIKHAPLDIDKGIRNFSRKIKYFTYLFPNYRSIYGIGSHAADEYWALHESAFPRAGVKSLIIPIDRFKEKIPTSNVLIEANKRSVVYLDQPLTRLNLSAGSIASTIKGHINKLESEHTIKNYFLKKHPVSTPKELDSLVRIFKNATDATIEIIDSSASAESMSMSTAFNPIEVFSFLSSALYTIKSLRPDINVKGVVNGEIIKTAPYIKKYIESLSKIGISVIVYDKKN